MIVEAEMILIKNARVMDPESGFDQVTDILLDGKRIRQIGKVDDVSGIEQVIDASGMIAAPGLIDVHVHFRDPGFTYKEDLQTGSAAAAAPWRNGRRPARGRARAGRGSVRSRRRSAPRHSLSAAVWR